MKVLKMIADWRYNKDCKPKNAREYKDIPFNERDNNSWWYLHGELERFVCFDKATVTNSLSGGFAKETIEWSKFNGREILEVISEEPYFEMYLNDIVEVEIEGIYEPCIGYFYTTNEQKAIYKGKTYDLWKQRGLVCFKSDAEACFYALKCMKEKCTHL